MGTVSVMGEVINASTYQHNPRQPKVKHYLELSGGIKDNADKKKIYVVRANGSVETGRRRNVKRYDLRPGDVIVVPQKIRYVSGYRVFMETIDAVYKLAITAAVVMAIAK